MPPDETHLFIRLFNIATPLIEARPAQSGMLYVSA